MVDPFTQPDLMFAQGLGYAGFALRQQDHQLLQAWNGQMQDLMVEDRFLQLLQQFGFDLAELPGPVTTRELLAP